MAEPLTSSDIWRIERGWGTSGLASAEERKRFAAAGELPISGMEAVKLAEGRGISPTASKAEKEAWVASEVMLGKRPPTDLPKAYGGLGERPEATTRRGLRMQQEWDARQKLAMDIQQQQLEQDRVARQLDLQQKQEARLQRDQDFELEKARMLEERESKVQKEAGFIVDSIRGAIGPDGNVIARPIRPEDEDAVERLDNLAREFKLGIENKAAATMFSTLYGDALKYRQDKAEQGAKNEDLAMRLSVQTGKPMKELGEYTEQGIFKPNVSAMIGAAEQVKTEEEKKAEEKTIATEKRKAEAQAGVFEEKNIISQERELQKGIRKATEDLRKMNAAFAGRETLSERDQASIDAAKNTLLDLQIEKAALRDLVFETPEQYKAAIDAGKKPPVGTTIYIGRTPVKVK